jgi:hypothetical protein
VREESRSRAFSWAGSPSSPAGIPGDDHARYIIYVREPIHHPHEKKRIDMWERFSGGLRGEAFPSPTGPSSSQKGPGPWGGTVTMIRPPNTRPKGDCVTGARARAGRGEGGGAGGGRGDGGTDVVGIKDRFPPRRHARDRSSPPPSVRLYTAKNEKPRLGIKRYALRTFASTMRADATRWRGGEEDEGTTIQKKLSSSSPYFSLVRRDEQ